MGSQASVHNKQIADLSANRNFFWFQIAVAVVKECDLSQSRLKYGVGGHHELSPKVSLQFDLTNMPGFNFCPEFMTSMRTFTVRVAKSTCGRMFSILP